MKRATAAGETEQGFVLVGLIVAIFLILLALSVAAPRVAKQLRREREVEAVHRGNQYVRAVQLFYRKNGHYPGSVEQLEKANNIRYLRQRYADPLTGKPDWKLIHVGEAKTTVKGFFGKPLSGLPGAGGIGSSIGSGGSVGAGAGSSMGAGGSSLSGSSAFGSPGASGSSGSSLGSPSSFSSGASSFGSSSTSSTGSGNSVGSSTSSNGISSQSATSFTGTGAPIMGVRSAATGTAMVVVNEQTTYPTWEFIYDPRIEQLKAKASLLGGGPASANGSSSFGSSGSSSGMNGTSSPGTNGASSSGFGSSSSGASSFGSSSFGSGSSNPSPSPSSNPQQ